MNQLAAVCVCVCAAVHQTGPSDAISSVNRCCPDRPRGRGNGLRVRGEEATFVTSQPSAAFTLQVFTDEHWEFLSTCVSSEKCRLWLHSKQQLNSGEPEPNSTEMTAEGGGETSPPSSLDILFYMLLLLLRACSLVFTDFVSHILVLFVV